LPEPISIGIRARIADVADPVMIRVGLVRIEGERAVVHGAGISRNVRVAEAVPVRVETVIAGVSPAIPVTVILVGIEDIGAIVHRAEKDTKDFAGQRAESITVRVGAGITGITDPI